MSIHPIIHIGARQPQLLAEHAKAYGDLFVAELLQTLRSLAVHALLYGAAAVLAILGMFFGGFALLLYASVAGQLRDSWLLVAVPGTPILLAGLCFVIARVLPLKLTLGVIAEQVRSDIAMLHETGLQ